MDQNNIYDNKPDAEDNDIQRLIHHMDMKVIIQEVHRVAQALLHIMIILVTIHQDIITITLITIIPVIILAVIIHKDQDIRHTTII